MKTLRPSVRRVEWKGHGSRSRWLLQGFKEEGRYLRLFFPTKREALDELDRRLKDRSRFGELASSFGPADAAELAEAREILGPHGKTVREAAKFFTDYLDRTSKSATVGELLRIFLRAKKADGLGDRSLRDLRTRLERFSADFVGFKVAAITSAEIDDWLRALDLSPQSRRNYRTVLGTFFRFAMTHGYAVENPVAKATKVRVVRGNPEVLKPAQMRKLLKASDPRIVPALAVGGFAGLRAAEIARLDWSEIDLARGYIEVPAGKSKTAYRRLVKIRPNLHAWLSPFARSAGSVRHESERRLLSEAREKAKLKRWPANGLRHSFASYALAESNDAAAVSLELGHSTPKMLFEHYRELVRPEEAAAWWSIAPKKSKIIAFQADGGSA